MQGIRFDHVSKQFPGAAQFAVSDCTFHVEAGTTVVLLGLSGCGKTTLLKMVNRLIEPTSGAIYLDDTDVRHLPVTALRRQIGYVIQRVGLFPHMSVADNIAVVPRLLGWSRARIAERVDELLTLVALPPAVYRDRSPVHLSGGQQQRVGLARALAADPGIILMDEPFSALDTITRTSLQEELLRLQHTVRKTILFVTHDVDEALRLADHIVVMHGGRIVQDGTPLAVLTRPANDVVRDLMGTDSVLRQLSLQTVAGVMTTGPDHQPSGDAPVLQPADNLRHALVMLLHAGMPVLPVVEQGRVVGSITLEHIRTAVQCSAVGEMT